MKTNILGLSILSLAIVGLSAIPFSPAYADEEETYLYVNQSGELKIEVADNPGEAILEAENRAPHSGVMLYSTTYVESQTHLDDEEKVYGYIDVNGVFRTEVAESAHEAILEAEAISEHSGVIIVSE